MYTLIKKMHEIEIKQIILSTKSQLISVNTLFTSLQLQRDKATLFDSHIAASCLLHSAAAAVKWDTMKAASWGSNTTYTWKITSRFQEHRLRKKNTAEMVSLSHDWLEERLLSLRRKPSTVESALFSLWLEKITNNICIIWRKCS